MKRTHGGNVYAYEAAHGALPVDFSANINPLGMPAGATEAAGDALAMAVHYPDPACTVLREALAAHEGVAQEAILCGNGAADLIWRFAQAVRPRTALVCAPSFGEYALALEATGCEVRTHVLQESDGFAVTEAILPQLDGIDALCLCNPNNPTGRTIAPALLDAILARCDELGIYVLLDECFVDFLDEPFKHTRVGALAVHPRLVVLKAFTKYYAMPGLRLGYALCADINLLARMEAMGPPWSVSSIAQAAGIAALRDRGYRAATQSLVQGERMFMKQMLRQMGAQPMGEANFLLFQAAPDAAQRLAREGVLVRDCADFAGLGPGWLRVAVRARAENMRLISRLSGCLHG